MANMIMRVMMLCPEGDDDNYMCFLFTVALQNKLCLISCLVQNAFAKHVILIEL